MSTRRRTLGAIPIAHAAAAETFAGIVINRARKAATLAREGLCRRSLLVLGEAMQARGAFVIDHEGAFEGLPLVDPLRERLLHLDDATTVEIAQGYGTLRDLCLQGAKPGVPEVPPKPQGRAARILEF